jgi:ParB family chromosome partitioning protein
MDKNSSLQNIDIDRIKPNPDNPRIIFRQDEMDSLLVSIKKHGVQVPISVYKEGKDFIIIDGERRWKTCLKLNYKQIPAIIQEKPSELENLLMMFNIHALREQWDLFTIANKLTTIIDLLNNKNNYPPTEIQLNEETGLTRSTIRRCKLIIELPQKYKTIILDELRKPKAKQKVTEDFFIEMEKSLKTVKNNFPQLLNNIDEVRNNLITKFRKETIKNLLDLRKIAKIATAPKNLDYSRNDAENALKTIFDSNNNSIDQVFNSTVNILYSEKKLLSNFHSVLTHITSMNEEEREDQDIIEALLEIRSAIDKILKD